MVPVFSSSPPAITNQRFLPFFPPVGASVAERIEVTAAGDEYEPVSFAIYALQPLKAVMVKATALKPSGRSASSVVAPSPSVDVRVVDAAAAGLFGPAVAAALAAASTIIIAASISAMVLTGPRVYYAMAKDGQFFSAVARVHPKFHTPATAIMAQSLWSGLLVLTGTFDQLVEYTGFAVVLFAGVAVTALFVIRRREPNADRPFKAWGYPTAPLVFSASSLLLVLNAMWRSPETSLAGLSIIAAGVPMYFLFWRRSTVSDL